MDRWNMYMHSATPEVTVSASPLNRLAIAAANVTSFSALRTTVGGVDDDVTVAAEDDGCSVAGWIGTLAALHLLVMCVGANVLLVVSMSRRRWSLTAAASASANGYKSKCNTNNNNNISSISNVEMLITLIAGVGLVNGTGICITQIASHLFGNWMFNDTYCKLHGMASNLMTLLVVWFEALFAFERYMKFAKPQDYQVTFSKINLQVITLGIFLVLLSAVSGPLYGWGTYTYSRDVHTCQLDLTTPNAVSYFVLSTASYVVTPYVITAYSCSALLLNIHFPDREYSSGHSHHHQSSQFGSVPEHGTSLERRKIMLPLALSAAASFLLQLPKYVSETAKVLDPNNAGHDSDVRLLTYVGFWLHTFAVNVCFACVLLLFHGCYSRCRCGCCICCCCCLLAFRKTGSRSRVSRRGARDVALVMTSSGAARRGHTGYSDKLCYSCWPPTSTVESMGRRDVTPIGASVAQQSTGSQESENCQFIV